MNLLNLFVTGATILLFTSCASVKGNESGQLKLFTSDGCSGFPDGTIEQKNLWLNCCVAHDYDYWKGGTYAERLASDKRLKTCVADVGEPVIALLMLAGVRVGGSPYLPTQFRWGYGWDYPSYYGELTPQQQQQVKQKMPLCFVGVD